MLGGEGFLGGRFGSGFREFQGGGKSRDIDRTYEFHSYMLVLVNGDVERRDGWLWL